MLKHENVSLISNFNPTALLTSRERRNGGKIVKDLSGDYLDFPTSFPLIVRPLCHSLSRYLSHHGRDAIFGRNFSK